MKKLFLSVLILTGLLSAQSTEWTIDKTHSSVNFSVDHMVVSEVVGSFKSFDGKILTNGDNFEDAKISFEIDVKSINTDNTGRDEHLVSDDFFNAEKFPKIKFEGKEMKKISDKKYKLKGNFTMRDITKWIELDVKFNGTVVDGKGRTKAGFVISGAVNRFDYNLKWSKVLDGGGLVVGDEVRINCALALFKK